MYWEGTVHRIIEVPKGSSLLCIEARGERCFAVWPYMVIELDGYDIGETFVESPQWKTYRFPVRSNGGIQVLSVSFLNDAYDERTDKDRNLHVRDVCIEVHNEKIYE